MISVSYKVTYVASGTVTCYLYLQLERTSQFVWMPFFLNRSSRKCIKCQVKNTVLVFWVVWWCLPLILPSTWEAEAGRIQISLDIYWLPNQPDLHDDWHPVSKKMRRRKEKKNKLFKLNLRNWRWKDTAYFLFLSHTKDRIFFKKK